MEEIASFSLENQTETNSELLFDQKQCLASISGVILEKQYQLAIGYFLLFTTDDSPYEECLHITLLNNKFKKIDCLDIGLPYGSAIFDNPEVKSDQSIEFDFFKDVRYRLSINTNGARFQLAKRLSEISFCNMPFQKRYLNIERISEQGEE